MRFRRLVDDLLWYVSQRRPLVLSVGAAVLVIIAAMILVLTIPRGVASHRAETSASIMDVDTQAYFSINLLPSRGQLRKMAQLVGAFQANPTAMGMWDEWMDEIQRETGIDVQREVFPWLGPELAIGISGLTEEEPEFLIALGTREASASMQALKKWCEYLEDMEGIEWQSSFYRNVPVVVGETYYEEKQYYTVTHDYVLVSNDERRLKRAVDLVKDGGTSLADNSRFKEVRHSLPAERVAMLFALTGELYADMIAVYGGERAIMWSFNSLIPSYLAGTIQILGDGAEVTLGGPRLDGRRYRLNTASEELTAMIPASAAYCVLGDDLYGVWQDFRERVSEDRQLEESFEYDVMEDLRYGLGLDFGDPFWRNLDGKFAVAGFGAYPDLVVILEIDSEEQVASQLDGLLSRIKRTQYEMEFDHILIEEAQATLIRSEDLRYEGLSPGYLFLGGRYLVFSFTVEALRAAVRTYQGRYDSLKNSESYKQALSALPHDKGWITYVNAPIVMDYLLAGFDPWEREMFEDLPRFQDVLSGGALSFLISEESVSASMIVHLSPSVR